jgi:hypothetical protein
MKDFIFIIIGVITFILILKYSGYDNPEKQKRERRVIEIIDPMYDKKYPKKY